MVKLTFYGAIEGVTGSAYLVVTESATILLEYGLFQGSRKEEKANDKPFPFSIGKLDAVVLSHAHIDYSRRLPALLADGYNGPIFMTYPTTDLLEIMLKDAASLQQRDMEWENKRCRRAGKSEIEPLYTVDDVDTAMELCVGFDYADRQEIANGVQVRFNDAGHILGSSLVEIFITQAGVEKTLAFSGDLGNRFAA